MAKEKSKTTLNSLKNSPQRETMIKFITNKTLSINSKAILIRKRNRIMLQISIESKVIVHSKFMGVRLNRM